MRRITQKLHSPRGASLIYALLLFLVASLISILILNASVTAAKRLADDREREQEYLALSSAARLIRTKLKSSWVKITETETLEDGVRTGKTEPVYTCDDGPLGETLNACVQALNGPPPAGGTLYEVLNSPDYTGDAESTGFEVEVTTDKSERFPNVSVAARPEPLMYLKKTVEGEIKRYYISAALTLVNGETEGEQTIYLTADATLKPSSSSSSVLVKTGEGESDMSTRVTTVYTTTITWENVNLSTIPPKE